MIKHETNVKDCYVLEPKINGDHRGYLFEAYNENTYKNLGIYDNFVQENQSKSTKNVLRGLHYQSSISANSKLRRCIKGEIFDICVDMRKDSPTFGNINTIILSEDNNKIHYIPRGCAAGLLTLSDESIFVYLLDNVYYPNNEHGVLWNDKKICINYPINEKDIIVSEKDKNQPKFDDAFYC